MILSMCIAYNLTRLVLLEIERGTSLDFRGGIEQLVAQPWVELEEHYSTHRNQ